MVPLPFLASFLARMGNQPLRYSQSDPLRYDCRGVVITSCRRIPSCALHGGA